MENTKNYITVDEFSELANQIQRIVNDAEDFVQGTMEDLGGEGVNTLYNEEAMAPDGACASFDVVTEIYDVKNGIDSYGDIYNTRYDYTKSFKYKVYAEHIVFYTPDGYEAEPVEDIEDMFCNEGEWKY